MLIAPSSLSNLIEFALSQGADFCEVYAEETFSSLMKLKSSKTEYISGKDQGVGIRVFYGNQEFYTHTNSFKEDILMKALKSLTQFNQAPVDKAKLLNQEAPVFSFQYNFPLEEKRNLEKEKKLLQLLDKEAHSKSSLISQCQFTLTRTDKRVQVANSEALLSFDHRPSLLFSVQAIAEDQNLKEDGFSSLGRSGDPHFLDEELMRQKTKIAFTTALRNLKAKPAPSGKLPVIINKGFGGVIFHEACGHGMETTSVADKISIFSDKLGQKIAGNCVSAYDDGTLEGEYGSLKKDDEGQDTQRTCLIDKGVLKSYMVDKMGSQKTNYKMTGSARRQSYKFPPTSRMRNTYIDRGDSSLEEMIKDIDYGLFAESLGGGSVAPGTGNYNFAVHSGFLIKKGRLDAPVKGASLVGNGLDTLSKIKKVGSDLELAPGHCGSISGWVPVTVGQPPLLVSEITVGGTSQK